MTDLQSLPDVIKIPYPTEGVIRTANIDDTVTPENSVQLAVNMNFDRIGSIQTRPGVTSIADTLADGITNYGVLKNVYPDGYENVSQLATAESFATFAAFLTSVKIDDTHVMVFWTDADLHGRVQIMEVDPTTGGFTPLSTAYQFDSTNDLWNKCIMVDSTHVLNLWRGTDNDGFARVFTWNATTYAVSALASAYEFDTTDSTKMSLAQIDSSHFISFYTGNNDADGIATVLAVNLSTYAVTEPGSPLTFASGTGGDNSCVALGDGTHFINFWSGKSQVFSVNTGTWAISAIGSALTFDAGGSTYNSALTLSDGQHFINFWRNGSGVGKSRVFNVNLSTFAVTSLGTEFQFSATAYQNAAVAVGDGQHFVNFWSKSSVEGYSQVFTVNLSTFQISANGTPYDFGGLSTLGVSATAVLMSPYRIMTFWATKNSGAENLGAIFRLTGSLIQGRLYAQSGDSVYSLSGTTWTSRRSGLSEVSKARFTQYLGYIWMVNGNKSIGGDPVATSNGGNFGTNLVPADFPEGDFISGGFEGRVWVFDKSLGIVYYTDIVQYSPPNSYTLSFNKDVNFITTIAPQTGQQFTGVYQVPRALLVFTQDYIFRIYGASSLDAYPAYNVGTYSQESIVETKTGIFFHHSSGFYQFDYGSQPVEISRRIIDFVKAIPRANYDDIVGVYDGFDAVEWSIGSVTVEGVTFSNCVVRYTISTQVWTIYDYVGNTIKAMISYDSGTELYHLMGTEAGKTGAMDTGVTDFGEPFYYEYIDRWRSFTDSYAKQKSITGINLYSENAAGANIVYQIQKSGPNAWEPIGTVNELNNSVLPNNGTSDFDVIRLRVVGTSRGTPVVIHGVEILSLIIKGFDQN